MGRDHSPLFDFYAAELRRLRGKTSQDALGRRLGFSAELVGKVEKRERRPTAEFARACDAAFPVANGVFARLVAEAERSGGARPAWVASWADAEQRASVLRSWEPLIVPVLLQTAGYARALAEAWQGLDALGDIDDLVTARLDRQRIFERAAPPSFWALIDETVLYRRIGADQVMHDQLVHLAELASRPRVTVEVLPGGVGAHVGLLGAFALADFPDGTPPMAYLESSSGAGEITRQPGIVARIELTFDTLRTETLGGRASRDLIRKVAEDQWAA